MNASPIVPGANGLPKLVLVAADGARAEIYLHGAHVASWMAAGEDADRLFLSRSSEFRAGVAIRGGVPVIFPQFNVEGPLVKHGFARVQAWELAGSAIDASGLACAALRLADSAASRAIWPHAFQAELTVGVGASTLGMTLAVHNTGASAFTFTVALHTYLSIGDLAHTRVLGLRNLRYRDSAAANVEGVQSAAELAIEGEVDRIFFNAPSSIEVREPDRSMRVEAAGFPDVVVWNPGAARGASIADLEPDGYARMLCIEAAAIGTPVTLDADGKWQGSQRLIASHR